MEILPKIEPLFNELKKLSLGNFLISDDFKRMCIKNSIEQSWRNACEHAKKTRTYFSIDMDHQKADSIAALALILNHWYDNSRETFFAFIHNSLLEYTSWSKEDLDAKNIIEDLEMLNAPDNILENVKKMQSHFSIPVPSFQLPKDIWNVEKLDLMIQKMDSAIKNKDYNLTLTYSYTCLEGLYKSFISENIPNTKIKTLKLNQLASIVRDYIKEGLNNEKSDYPEQMINLIPTITNAVANARNSYSESHFDKVSEKWLAEFARDCVNSIGRLVLKF